MNILGLKFYFIRTVHCHYRTLYKVDEQNSSLPYERMDIE